MAKNFSTFCVCIYILYLYLNDISKEIIIIVSINRMDAKTNGDISLDL